MSDHAAGREASLGTLGLERSCTLVMWQDPARADLCFVRSCVLVLLIIGDAMCWSGWTFSLEGTRLNQSGLQGGAEST